MIRRQVVLPVGPDRLWDALTDPGQAAGWFGGRIDWDLVEGSPLRFAADDGYSKEGRVEAVRPGQYLRYRWWEDDGENASEVSYLLEPHEGGTRLTIQEREIDGDSRTAQASARDLTAAPSTSFSWSSWDTRMAGAWIQTSAGAALRAGS